MTAAAIGLCLSIIFAVANMSAYLLGANQRKQLPPPSEVPQPVFVALVERLEDGTTSWRPHGGGLVSGLYFVRLVEDGAFEVMVGGVNPGRVLTGVGSWSRLKTAYQRALVNMAADAELSR